MIWLSDMFTARKQTLFLNLMKEHADLLVQAASALEQQFRAPSGQSTDAIAALSSRSEKIVTQTIQALTDTFVTPFDRQDLYNLAQGIDDMISYLASAEDETRLFKIDPTPQMCEMARLLKVGAIDIKTAIDNIEHASATAVECSNKARQTEDAVEDVYRRTIAELFNTADVHRIFKLREIYRHLSNGADRADAIGKLVGKIVVKVA